MADRASTGDTSVKEIPTDEQKVRPVVMGLRMLRTVRGVRGKIRAMALLILHILP
jgi:hypothetical protein